MSRYELHAAMAATRRHDHRFQRDFEPILEEPALQIARAMQPAIYMLIVAQNPTTNDPDKAEQRHIQPEAAIAGRTRAAGYSGRCHMHWGGIWRTWSV